MNPAELKPEDFSAYSPLGRKTSIEYIGLLQQLPAGFVPFLLKETISLDWKFPAEREDLLWQLAYLKALPEASRQAEMAQFAGLRLTPELQSIDWVNAPGQYVEKLSAHLWATSQMDTFRNASEQYMQQFRAAYPETDPAIPRLAIVLVGQGVSANQYPLFRKLKREGVYFSQVAAAGAGPASVFRILQSRASSHPSPYAHWFIDGGDSPGWNAGTAATANAASPVLISYPQLSPMRLALSRRMQQAFESRTPSETLRTMLAATTPRDLGLPTSGVDQPLERFQVALFTEGSGTQIYSTTFVQWAAREALRRAKPLTVVARFAPRQREAPMNELLSGDLKAVADPAGALVDGDMGAWYTWLNLQRIKGAEQSRFLVWFETGTEAVAIGPGFAKGTQSTSQITIDELLKRLV